MFIAKFETVNNSTNKFKADRHGVLPLIGTVIAGHARGTIMNGTMFADRGYEQNKLYACQNVTVTDDKSGETYINTEIIGEVSIVEFVQLKKELGEPRVTVPKKEEVEEVEDVRAD